MVNSVKRLHPVMMLVVSLAAIALADGCVERRFIVRTEPEDAQIILDGEDAGLAPKTFSFIYYGTREIVVKKEGYETLKTYEEVNAPIYQRFPLDIFAELVYPGTIVDERVFTYTLQKAHLFDEKEFLDRARSVREREKGPE